MNIFDKRTTDTGMFQSLNCDEKLILKINVSLEFLYNYLSCCSLI